MANPLFFDPNTSYYEAPNGVKYEKDPTKGNYWYQKLDGDEYFNDRYVEVPGDTMTGSLISPSFTGNLNIEAMEQLT